MKYPFYLDARDAGGLGMAAADLAWISILAEMPWMMIGGILGGFTIKWLGLRRVFIPLALAINLPNLVYYWLAVTQPSTSIIIFGQSLNISLLGASSFEAFFYGMSFSAMFYYMHIKATESGRNKTSILAISFALMGLGWTIPGMLSGYVQESIGYTGVFLISAIAGLPTLLIIPFLPYADKTEVAPENRTRG
jgi:PAT family beta-lactamase induction signal transducer AmpG